jgi:hypothetical protein
MIKNNSKVYKFKISIGNSLDYAKKYINEKIIGIGYYRGMTDFPIFDKYMDGTILIYDELMNKQKIIELNVSHYNNNVYWCIDDSSNIQTKYARQNRYEYENKYIMGFYNNFDYDSINHKNYDLIKHIYSNILNYNLINILIKNVCKDFFVEYIDITLRDIACTLVHNIEAAKYTIDTITIIIDETKPSNNRNIKIYKEFNDFYQNRDSTKKYKIIKDINNLCIIEELESTQNLSENKDLTKSPQEIIINKDLEIEKLKKEIQELKKFYINSS